MLPGILYIVATPIGNLKDITLRALEVLKEVDYIAAEDTRHTRQLLNHYGLSGLLISLHEFNEDQRLHKILNDLKAGKKVALVSDAGTPLISDPGYPLVNYIRANGGHVIPIPGACAAIAALMASGLPADHFVFEGFLPSKSSARMKRLQTLAPETRTLIFYESVHRIQACLSEMSQILGLDRVAVVARELTKKFETIQAGTLDSLTNHFEEHQDQIRGEFVVLVKGAELTTTLDEVEANRILKILLDEFPTKQAVNLTAKILNYKISKKTLYQQAIQTN